MRQHFGVLEARNLNFPFVIVIDESIDKQINPSSWKKSLLNDRKLI